MALKKKKVSKATLAKTSKANNKKPVKKTASTSRTSTKKSGGTKTSVVVKSKQNNKAKKVSVNKSAAKQHAISLTKKATKKAIVKKEKSKTVAAKRIAATNSKKINSAKKSTPQKNIKAVTSLKNSSKNKIVVTKKTLAKKPAKQLVNKTSKASKNTNSTKTVVTTKAIASKKINSETTISANASVSEKPLKEKVNSTIINGTEKLVKIGVKTKKQIIAIEPLPVVEVSTFPKHKVKTLLISQPKPENEKNPYYDLAQKFNLSINFRQFIKIEGLPSKDFRAQRIDILEHKAVILTSRTAVDHYFRTCNEMRVTVPESMKYFCINEATAYYLQKYIQYRKRKIFFGHQTIQDLVDVIKKNREEKFLLPAADVQKEKICDFLDALNIKYTKAIMYRTVSANLSDIKTLNDYDVLVFFTPAGIKSLKENFPNFKQGNTRIGCFGIAAANALKNAGFRLDIYAPNPKNPSMTGALDEYIKEANKR